MTVTKSAGTFRRHATWLVGVAAVLTSAGATANAANLVNRGGSKDVPTYEGRIHYIKASGATCPTGFNCFCNSGTTCTLPNTGTITGTVVIDRSGVTLDCQNRTIQAPRFAGSNQVCTSSSQCGKYNGTKTHVCVNGYCQLHNLGGINVGGPAQVDEGTINIDVTATGYVQDVKVMNCEIKSFATAYRVDGDTGDNGLDELIVRDSEFRSNGYGMGMFSTDSSYVSSNWVHDNYGAGLYYDYNWGVQNFFNRMEFNQGHPIYVRSDPAIGYNRWFQATDNDIFSDHINSSHSIMILNLEGDGSGATLCNSNASKCDAWIDANYFLNSMFGANIYFSFLPFDGPPAPGPAAKWLLRNNGMNFTPPANEGHLYVWSDPRKLPNRICWNKNNVCKVGTTPETCSDTALFAGTTCWY